MLKGEILLGPVANSDQSVYIVIYEAVAVCSGYRIESRGDITLSFQTNQSAIRLVVK